MMQALAALVGITTVVRTVLLAGGVALGAVAVADWAVRTRRISPFSGVARLMRGTVEPRLTGIERQVVRFGAHPSATPWWALVAYVVVASVVLWILDTIGRLVQSVAFAASAGGAGMAALLVHWIFAFLSFALLVRVLSSWLPRAAGSPWFRWSHGATEWMLRPLRRVIPTIGMVDITPIAAYFILQIMEGPVTRLLFPGF